MYNKKKPISLLDAIRLLERDVAVNTRAATEIVNDLNDILRLVKALDMSRKEIMG